jgi:hypothetical protein
MKDTKTLEILKSVKEEVLNSPERWTQGASARQDDGGVVSYESGEAVCWCLTGAVALVARKMPLCETGESEFSRTMAVLAIAIDPTLTRYVSIPSWNDAYTTKYEDVIAVIDRAIENHSREIET